MRERFSDIMSGKRNKTETQNQTKLTWLRELTKGPVLWEQEVGGSNPPVPTSYFR